MYMKETKLAHKNKYLCGNNIIHVSDSKHVILIKVTILLSLLNILLWQYLVITNSFINHLLLTNFTLLLIISSMLIGSLLSMFSNLTSVMVRAHTTCAHLPLLVGLRAPPLIQHKQHSCKYTYRWFIHVQLVNDQYKLGTFGN